MSNEGKGRSDNELTIKIETTQGPWVTTFSKTSKIHEVIQAVLDKFGFSKSGKYELRLERMPDENLNHERTLVSYGIKDGDVLRLTDLGVAV